MPLYYKDVSLLQEVYQQLTDYTTENYSSILNETVLLSVHER